MIEATSRPRYSPLVDRERFKDFIGALSKKEVNNAPCPRCRSTQIQKNAVKYAILGESFVYLCDRIEKGRCGPDETGGQPVAVVMIACNQCGYLMTHAQAALGVPPPRTPGG
jgi:predicted Zn-ribbon and HTH transcriptional regulator